MGFQGQYLIAHTSSPFKMCEALGFNVDYIPAFGDQCGFTGMLIYIADKMDIRMVL